MLEDATNFEEQIFNIVNGGIFDESKPNGESRWLKLLDDNKYNVYILFTSDDIDYEASKIVEIEKYPHESFNKDFTIDFKIQKYNDNSFVLVSTIDYKEGYEQVDFDFEYQTLSFTLEIKRKDGTYVFEKQKVYVYRRGSKVQVSNHNLYIPEFKTSNEEYINFFEIYSNDEKILPIKDSGEGELTYNLTFGNTIKIKFNTPFKIYKYGDLTNINNPSYTKFDFKIPNEFKAPSSELVLNNVIWEIDENDGIYLNETKNDVVVVDDVDVRENEFIIGYATDNNEIFFKVASESKDSLYHSCVINGKNVVYDIHYDESYNDTPYRTLEYFIIRPTSKTGSLRLYEFPNFITVLSIESSPFNNNLSCQYRKEYDDVVLETTYKSKQLGQRCPFATNYNINEPNLSFANSNYNFELSAFGTNGLLILDTNDIDSSINKSGINFDNKNYNIPLSSDSIKMYFKCKFPGEKYSIIFALYGFNDKIIYSKEFEYSYFIENGFSYDDNGMGVHISKVYDCVYKFTYSPIVSKSIASYIKAKKLEIMLGGDVKIYYQFVFNYLNNSKELKLLPNNFGGCNISEGIITANIKNAKYDIDKIEKFYKNFNPIYIPLFQKSIKDTIINDEISQFENSGNIIQVSPSLSIKEIVEYGSYISLVPIMAEFNISLNGSYSQDGYRDDAIYGLQMSMLLVNRLGEIIDREGHKLIDNAFEIENIQKRIVKNIFKERTDIYEKWITFDSAFSDYLDKKSNTYSSESYNLFTTDGLFKLEIGLAEKILNKVGISIETASTTNDSITVSINFSMLFNELGSDLLKSLMKSGFPETHLMIAFSLFGNTRIFLFGSPLVCDSDITIADLDTNNKMQCKGTLEYGDFKYTMDYSKDYAI